MKRNGKIITLLLFLALLTGRCKETYISPYMAPATGYLVVEGYISGNSPTTFNLSRVISLPGDSAIPVETGAKLQVEGNDNSVYPLSEQGNGVYSVGTLPLTAAVQYRLRIQTTNGESYLSDYTPYRNTPAIDSISWIQTTSGVSVYANTHDPANATRYYQWSFEETWQYTSAELSELKYQPHNSIYKHDTAIMRADSEYIYTCWQDMFSTPLLLGSSVKLTQDVIYRQPLQFIPTGDQRLSILYSMLVKQYALTENAYNFLSLMKSNTESLGSIFDAQPSQLKGNIHCLTNPSEPVVGYVSAGTVQQQRIYISAKQLSNWGYAYSCPVKDTLVHVDKADSFFHYYGFIPLLGVYNSGYLQGWWSNYETCIDCRLQGGTTKKPAYWPN